MVRFEEIEIDGLKRFEEIDDEAIQFEEICELKRFSSNQSMVQFESIDDSV